MGDKIVVRIDDREVLKALEGLRTGMQRVLMKSAMAAAEPIVDEANRKAIKPVVMAQVKDESAHEVEVEIGVPRKDYVVAIFETGAQPHEIAPHKKKSIFFQGNQGEVFTRLVKHPGMPARPFLRPALDSKKDEAVKNFKDKVLELIEEVREK